VASRGDLVIYDLSFLIFYFFDFFPAFSVPSVAEQRTPYYEDFSGIWWTFCLIVRRIDNKTMNGE
jgi:hypothetical protein